MRPSSRFSVKNRGNAEKICYEVKRKAHSHFGTRADLDSWQTFAFGKRKRTTKFLRFLCPIRHRRALPRHPSVPFRPLISVPVFWRRWRRRHRHRIRGFRAWSRGRRISRLPRERR